MGVRLLLGLSCVQSVRSKGRSLSWARYREAGKGRRRQGNRQSVQVGHV